MSDKTKLSEDQQECIKATLSRIRSGLRREQTHQFEEPAHIFRPVTFDAE